MRTIKVTVITRVSLDMSLEIETEAIVEDEHAEQAGIDAAKTIRDFLDGYSDELNRGAE